MLSLGTQTHVKTDGPQGTSGADSESKHLTRPKLRIELTIRTKASPVSLEEPGQE